MTTKSHYALALYLLRNTIDLNSAFAKAAFILGCVEPDLNVTTYLKGSLSCQPLRGHNYPNAAHYMETLFRKMQHCDKRSILYWYRLGKLLHYLTDAFTHPHNQNFTGTLHDHVRYEQEAERVFESVLLAQEATPLIYETNTPYTFFSSTHEKYLKQRPGAETDIRFIFAVIPSVFRSLYIHPDITDGREMKYYESSFNL